MANQRYLSPPPHVTAKDSIPTLMFSVILALLPAGLFGIYVFGWHALWVIVVSMTTAVITEAGCQWLMKRPIEVKDGSALLTGLLLAYNLPPEVPLWLPIVGTFVGIAIGKALFGGLGYNPMNPALVGRAFLMLSWPSHMTVFTTAPRGSTLSGVDGITSATPLQLFKATREILIHGAGQPAEKVTEAAHTLSRLYGAYGNLFWGKVGGCIGETSAFLLLVGAAFLLYRRVIGWKIPIAFLGTVALFTWMFGGTEGLFTGNPIFHLLSGGLILGAFYMATDLVTSPVTVWGRIWFGVGCGLLTSVIRLWGGYPEGVSYSILLMNLTVPLLDKFTRPRVFGGR